MPRLGLSVVLPALVALGAGGAWAGSALSALPAPPTLPTVTLPIPLPPAPVPVPAPPAVAVPPAVEAPPVTTPPAPVDPPVAVAPATAPPSISPVYSASETPTRSNNAPTPRRHPAAAPARERNSGVRAGASAQAPKAEKTAQDETTAVHGPVPEDAGFFGPIGGAFSALDIPAEVIPPALLAMAALAILLLGLASAPLPARTSRAGATLVHMRGSIAFAGVAALMMALGSYLLL